MKKWIFAMMLLPLLATALISCGDDDIKPKRAEVDRPGIVFIENGRYDTIPTSFTTEQLREALINSKWEFSYSFLYDDYKIGGKNEDRYVSRFRYEYKDDDTAIATDMSSGKQYNYTYSLNARTVTLKGASSVFSFGVIALDSRHMIVDENHNGEMAEGYDSPSLMRRMVFMARK